jgi:hypothetical protein
MECGCYAAQPKDVDHELAAGQVATDATFGAEEVLRGWALSVSPAPRASGNSRNACSQSHVMQLPVATNYLREPDLRVLADPLEDEDSS